MSDILINIGLVVGTFIAMEGVAIFSHKYVMHGCLWVLHESHHRPRLGRFELNDFFGLMFAVPSMILVYVGWYYFEPLKWVGFGMAGYGVIYFVFHDVIVHQRIHFRAIPRSAYLRRIVQAHRLHHARSAKEGCVSFGFLIAPPVRELKAQLRAINDGA